MQHHKYSYSDLEDMLPWERQLYVTLLVQYVEEENEKQKKHQRLKGKKEELVGEVINYLLNKEATL